MQYDGTGKLREAIADLYGLSLGSVAQIAAHIKKAKADLGITSKSKNLPVNDKLAIYLWHCDKLGKALDDTPTKDIGPLVEVVAVQATPETETPTADSGDCSDNEASAVIIDTGEALGDLPTSPEAPPENGNAPIAAIDPTPMTATTEPQRSSNWGGVRQGSGRKATGKQTVTMRVPVELAGFVKELKAIGDTQGQAALLAVIGGFESMLQHSSRADALTQ